MMLNLGGFEVGFLLDIFRIGFGISGLLSFISLSSILIIILLTC